MDKSRAFKKGSDFETAVFLKLGRALRGSLIMHNVHIPYNPNPAQIDLLVVRGWSFYVLELKNYEYSLAGSLVEKKWIAKSDTRTYRVQNPILQNNIQASKLVQKLHFMGFPDYIELRPYVIIPDSCRLEVEPCLKHAIFTVDTFIKIALRSKPSNGIGDISRLRETLLLWKR